MDSDVVSSQIRELNAVKSQKRIWQIGAICLVVLIAIVCLARLRSAVLGLVNEGPAQKAFMDDMGTAMQTKVIPAVQDLGSQALHEIDFGSQVKRLNEHTPALASIGLEQLRILSDNLPKRGEKVWKSTFEASMKGREGKLKQMFPDLKEDQVNTIMTNLLSEAQLQVVSINDELFLKHQQALKEIEQGINHIRDTEAKTGAPEPATWEMGLVIFDIAREDLRALESKPEAAKPAAKAKGGKK